MNTQPYLYARETDYWNSNSLPLMPRLCTLPDFTTKFSLACGLLYSISPGLV